MNTLDADPTPEQLEQYYSTPSMQDLFMNEVIHNIDETWTEVKVIQWRIFTGYKKWWKVDSREEVELNFQHSGSDYTNNFPLLVLNWNESLNEHAPLTFGPGVQTVVSHVIGQLSVYGIELYGDNFAILSAR